MLGRIFPQCIDNHHRGHKLAIWLFIPIVFVHIAIALGAIFNGREGAQSADKIPLDTYTVGGAEAVISLFALLGLSRFIFGLILLLVLIRYRAMIPLMYVLLLVEFLARKGILLAMPIAATGTSVATVIGLVLLALMVTGLVLSLWPSSASSLRDPGTASGNP